MGQKNFPHCHPFTGPSSRPQYFHLPRHKLKQSILKEAPGLIITEPEKVTRTLQENWLGREVRVSKTEPVPPVQFTLGEARLVDWQEVGEAIRARVPENTPFMSLSGRGDQAHMHTLLIPLGKDAVCDLRQHRLVLLTDNEVVQVNPVDNNPGS